MSNSWRPSRGEHVRYFLAASFVMIVQIIGLLFLGIWLGKQVSFWVGVFGAILGGMGGLASGAYCLYRMALRWEKNVLEKLGKQLCPNCKKSFEMEVTKCPHCEYEAVPTTQNTSLSD